MGVIHGCHMKIWNVPSMHILRVLFWFSTKNASTEQKFLQNIGTYSDREIDRPCIELCFNDMTINQTRDWSITFKYSTALPETYIWRRDIIHVFDDVMWYLMTSRDALTLTWPGHVTLKEKVTLSYWNTCRVVPTAMFFGSEVNISGFPVKSRG